MGMHFAERLRAARRRTFVGREEGKAHFRAMLDAGELEYFILWVHGPGGLGKTSLLHEFVHLAQQGGCQTAYLDCRNVEPTPQTFQAALHSALGLNPDEHLLTSLAARSAEQRAVILLDTCENIAALDDWLREQFLPGFPDNVFLVMAGRDEPTHPWRSDPGWQTMLRTLPLRYLDTAESVDLLARRNVPEDQRETVARFTHGFPLALSLVADVFDQQPDYRFEPEAAVDIISLLVTQLMDEAPGPAHRATLEACCLVRGTTEALLAELLQTPDAHELFRWLRSLSFIDSGPRGIFPHDMAREVLHADLRWRNPDWYAQLHQRARAYYTARLQQTQGVEQQRAMFDLIYLHRENPMVKPFFEWRTAAGGVPDHLVEGDIPALVEMVARYEGPDSARIAAHWLQRAPGEVLVLRDGKLRPIGFFQMVSLHTVTPADLAIDPGTRAARAWLDQNAPLRSGDRATFFRFWMAEESYQSVSPVQSMLLTNIVRQYLTTPRLAYALVCCAEPDFWSAAFTYADFLRLPAADFCVDERSFGVYGRDWRTSPPLAWLALLGDRELGAAIHAAQPAPLPGLKVLSEPDFAASVRETIHSLTRPSDLRDNPLLYSHLVAAHVDPYADAGERSAQLLQRVVAAIETLQSSPRDLKLFRALHHTYVKPAATQEAAAELLDLPFSTYRRHLKDGIERLTLLLWQEETGQ